MKFYFSLGVPLGGSSGRSPPDPPGGSPGGPPGDPPGRPPGGAREGPPGIPNRTPQPYSGARLRLARAGLRRPPPLRDLRRPRPNLLLRLRPPLVLRLRPARLLGDAVGCALGLVVGETVGLTLGIGVGLLDGAKLGDADGRALGDSDGLLDGRSGFNVVKSGARHRSVIEAEVRCISAVALLLLLALPLRPPATKLPHLF